MKLLTALFSVSLLAFGISSTSAFGSPQKLDEDIKEVIKRKAILVTGASSGIGLNITKSLSEQGYFVYAGARKDKDLKRLDAMKNVQSVRLDVTIQEDIDKAVEFVNKQGRGLYGLVNNAGVAVFGPLIEMSESDMQFQMNVNLFGPYRVSKAFAPLLIESKGRISTIGSISGAKASSFFGAYSMSKFAVEAFSDSLGLELKKFGVQVSIVEPGNYNSKIAKNANRRIRKNKENKLESLYQKELDAFTLFMTDDRSRFQEPDDVSAAVADALFSEKPKRRYMVVPKKAEAEWAIRGMITRMAQMNQSQEFSLSREELIEMLDEELEKLSSKSEEQ